MVGDVHLGPAAVLVGCELGADVYVATRAAVPPGSHVGTRQYAVADRDGTGTVITGDVDVARNHLAAADFFGTAFDLAAPDQLAQHQQVNRTLRAEAAGWADELLSPHRCISRLRRRTFVAGPDALIENPGGER